MPLRRSLAALALATLALTACGGSESSETPVGEVSLVVDPEMAVEEPEVDLPVTPPTELVVTVIDDGEGPAAVEGDSVFVQYVGVLSADGTRFDGNYGGEPFRVELGQGMVIPGWDQGLVGIRAGERRQLDIPADLAYGEQGAGSAIPPNSALSFVIDAVVVVPKTDPLDKPQLTVSPTQNLAELTITDLVEGKGPEAEAGSKVIVQLLAFRADTGEEIASTWEASQPLSFELTEGGTLPGVIEGLAGMKAGGRRQLHVPFAKAWGPGGQENIGLPPETDVIIVIDLLATF